MENNNTHECKNDHRFVTVIITVVTLVQVLIAHAQVRMTILDITSLDVIFTNCGVKEAVTHIS